MIERKHQEQQNKLFEIANLVPNTNRILHPQKAILHTVHEHGSALESVVETRI